MKGLFLYGLHCTKSVWDPVKDRFSAIGAEYAEYPHEVLKEAQTVSDLTRWVYERYKDCRFDFIVGHSMGGIIALELAAVYSFPVSCVIFIDTNLKPANAFYRNLMLPANMEKYGQPVGDMLKSESAFSSGSLIQSLQDDFDYTAYLKRISCPIYGIYGDRGRENYDKRVVDLCLDAETVNRITFKFVKDACHLPMIEAPEALANLLYESLEEAELI